MRAGVILVNYNTRELLRQALQSILASAYAAGIASDDVTIVVVDNASTDDSVDMVDKEFPDVELIALSENAGFTRANNLALEQLGFDLRQRTRSDPARPDVVLLMNPDAQLANDALHQLMRFLERHPKAGACGPRLQYADGSFQHGAFRFPSLAQVALDLFPLRAAPGAWRLYGGRVNGRYAADLWDGEEPFAVDFVLGAALMMRGTAIERIGGLDEGYFMYCEEMDWCLRLAEAGMQTYAVPAARVIHHEGQSSRQKPWPSFRNLWRSRIRFYSIHSARFSRGHALRVRVLLRAAMLLRAREARRLFARGRWTGAQTADALAAYEYVARL